MGDEEQQERRRRSIAVEFDGVIHQARTPWTAPDVIPDPPVEGAAAWLEQMAETHDVFVISQRVSSPDGAAAVRAWLIGNGFDPKWYALTDVKVGASMLVCARSWRFNGTRFPTEQAVRSSTPWNRRPADLKPRESWFEKAQRLRARVTKLEELLARARRERDKARELLAASWRYREIVEGLPEGTLGDPDKVTEEVGA